MNDNDIDFLHMDTTGQIGCLIECIRAILKPISLLDDEEKMFALFFLVNMYWDEKSKEHKRDFKEIQETFVNRYCKFGAEYLEYLKEDIKRMEKDKQ